MMDDLHIVEEDRRWSALDLAALGQRAVTATLRHLDVDPSAAEVSILACNDDRISALNADYRGKPAPTNVLSWPSQERGAPDDGGIPLPPKPDFDDVLELGDIAISYDTCSTEAQAMGKSMADHVTHLLVHGVLHLLGYDHERDADAALMEQIEVEVLGKLGLDDPYKENAGTLPASTHEDRT